VSEPGPSTAPPGWYPDATGHLRWWTGTTWGAYAPPASPGRTDARTLAMLAQLGQLVGGFIIPLVLYLTVGKEDPFVRHHSAEALNFSITYVLAFFAVMVAFVVGLVYPPLLIGVFLTLITVVVGHLVLLIVAAVHANQGEWWRYPVCIRLVPGAA
jgi:uncharacterized protein